MPKYTSRSSQKTKNKASARGRGQSQKGLTADGSTRAWRQARNALPGKPKRCPDGRPPFVNHKKSRRDGGTDTPGNLEWGCGKNPGTGRPRKGAPSAKFSPSNRARQS